MMVPWRGFDEVARIWRLAARVRPRGIYVGVPRRVEIDDQGRYVMSDKLPGIQRRDAHGHVALPSDSLTAALPPGHLTDPERPAALRRRCLG